MAKKFIEEILGEKLTTEDIEIHFQIKIIILKIELLLIEF